MQIIVIFIVFYFITYCVSNQSTKESPKDGQQNIITKSTTHDFTTDPADANKKSYYIWIRRPNNDIVDDFVPYRTVFRAPYSVTRLVKTFSPQFYPYFNKGHFEPFERRPKPVTVVAFRKNGFMPRSSVKKIESDSMEIAELQSPYNDVGSLWQDEHIII